MHEGNKHPTENHMQVTSIKIKLIIKDNQVIVVNNHKYVRSPI